MSDDLVKRLRHRVPEPGRPYKSDATVLVNPQGDEAADRIEELEATLLATCKREAATQARHDAKVTALEARADALAEQLAATKEKLERAVDGLREAENAPEPDHHVPQFRHVMDVIGATLAQITGGKTDET